ncbi:hypothetical protein BpHYR1_043645, partial [Brachionus plicatilis]
KRFLIKPKLLVAFPVNSKIKKYLTKRWKIIKVYVGIWRFCRGFHNWYRSKTTDQSGNEVNGEAMKDGGMSKDVNGSHLFVRFDPKKDLLCVTILKITIFGVFLILFFIQKMKNLVTK